MDEELEFRAPRGGVLGPAWAFWWPLLSGFGLAVAVALGTLAGAWSRWAALCLCSLWAASAFATYRWRKRRPLLALTRDALVISDSPFRRRSAFLYDDILELDCSSPARITFHGAGETTTEIPSEWLSAEDFRAFTEALRRRVGGHGPRL